MEALLMSSTTIIPLVITVGYHLLAHTTLGHKLFSALGMNNPLTPTVAPAVDKGSILAALKADVEAIAKAAVSQVVSDAVSGNVSAGKTGIAAEFEKIILAAEEKAKADMQAKLTAAVASVKDAVTK